MKSDRALPVAIVGAGFSGTMVAARLARLGIGSVLIDAERRAGRGTAFSTEEPAHLLNIPAEVMGAWAEEPEDFLARSGAGRGSYAERRSFGAYLRAILDEARASGHATVVNGRAIGASRTSGRWRVALGGGGEVETQALVLAMGNLPPARLPFADSAEGLIVDDPWGERAQAAVADAAARHTDVLIIGTSLTMIDVALSLDSAGHRGRIVALSRRGKIPLANGAGEPAPVEWQELPSPRIRDIAAWLRSRSEAIGWRAAVDSLRPHSHRLWQALPADQKRLFLRHGRPWWDIHRHRIAPEIAARVDELIANGRLRVVAGSVAGVTRSGDSLEVSIRSRGSDRAGPKQSFAHVFNCTGPLGDIGRTEDPLLRGLLDEGVARPDALAIGLDVDERSRVAGADRLWALGTLTKGRYWEMIAVPDIRQQAAAVAGDIATELGG